MSAISFTVFKPSEEGKIVKSTTKKPALERDHVLIKVTHSGLCGTNEHYRHADMVLGHEGAGVVQAIGPDATTMKPGDRVGWGYKHNCCRHCRYYLSGQETLCFDRAQYGGANFDQGSFASHAIWRESFLFRIPDNISTMDAAPLMCGGAAIFNILTMYNVRRHERIGIIGIGGLGHLAIQFAAKMGCAVVAFSGTDSKREEALSLGAKEFVVTKGEKKLSLQQPIDHLIVTTVA